MKITKEHFKFLESEINKFLESKANSISAIINNYETGKFINSDRTQDLQMRFCFDVFYAAKLPQSFISDFYKYGNDNHLYTALKQICPKVEKKY